MILLCFKHISLIKRIMFVIVKTLELETNRQYYPFLVSGCGVATRGWMAGNYRTAWLT